MQPSDQNLPGLSELLIRAERGEVSWSCLAEAVLQREHAAGAAHRPDLDRQRRCGYEEVIFGSGKSVDDIQQIAEQILATGVREVLATRVPGADATVLEQRLPHTRYSIEGRTLRMSLQPIATVNPRYVTTQAYQSNEPEPTQRQPTSEDTTGVASVAVVTAGSTDAPVGYEALETLRWMGFDPQFITDVGVAGPYRLLAHLESLRRCVAVVAVAGMEGALASVVGGLVPAPVIAVPTSVGYGTNFEGMTTLLSMLSSCAAGVTTVNIDAGFKGGYIAGLIANQVVRSREAGQPASR